MSEGITRKEFVSVDGEEYVPRRDLDDLRQERDRLSRRRSTSAATQSVGQ